MSNSHKTREKILYAAAIGISTFVLFFVITAVWIGYEAKSICQEAKWRYGGECVEALLAQLDDTGQSYRARNHAVWALGQYGDSRALPTLEKYFTGQVPDREPLNEVISQYELGKAISLSKGGINIASWAWR